MLVNCGLSTDNVQVVGNSLDKICEMYLKKDTEYKKYVQNIKNDQLSQENAL